MDPLEKRVEAVEKQLKDLNSFATIPFMVEGAFKERLKINLLAKIIVSTKGLTTENQAVNEAGASSYSVLKPPDAWLQLTISGTTYNIPVYT